MKNRVIKKHIIRKLASLFLVLVLTCCSAAKKYYYFDKYSVNENLSSSSHNAGINLDLDGTHEIKTEIIVLEEQGNHQTPLTQEELAFTIKNKNSLKEVNDFLADTIKVNQIKSTERKTESSTKDEKKNNFATAGLILSTVTLLLTLFYIPTGSVAILTLSIFTFFLPWF